MPVISIPSSNARLRYSAWAEFASRINSKIHNGEAEWRAGFIIALINSRRMNAVAKFDPQLAYIMRHALEEVMTKVPPEYSTSSTKAYLAECILKAAAQGHTSFEDLVAAAADQIQNALSLFVYCRKSSTTGSMSLRVSSANG
jgi:hypothetical protein